QLRAAAALVAPDVFEEEGRSLFLQDAPSDSADLVVPVHLRGNPPQIPFLLEKGYPLPHVHEAHPFTCFRVVQRATAGERRCTALDSVGGRFDAIAVSPASPQNENLA